jgi:hypothetical protein
MTRFQRSSCFRPPPALLGVSPTARLTRQQGARRRRGCLGGRRGKASGRPARASSAARRFRPTSRRQSGKNLRHRRDAWKRRHALLGAHAERSQPAAFHLRERHAEVVEHEVDFPAQERGHRGGGSLVGNVRDFQSGGRFEQLGGQVRGRTAALGSVVELVRVRPRIGDNSSTLWTGTSRIGKRTLGITAGMLTGTDFGIERELAVSSG